MRSQEDSDVEKRLLVAVLLSMAILFVTPYVYQYFFPVEERVTGEGQTRILETAPVEQPATPPEVETEDELLAAARGGEDARIAGEVRDLQVENREMVLRFSTKRARLVSIRLKNFFGEEGEPLELVPQQLPEAYSRPLELWSSDELIQARLLDAVFEADTQVASIQAPTEIVFRYGDGELLLEKRVAVPAEGYQLMVETDMIWRERAVPYGLVVGNGIGELLRETGDFVYPAIAYYQGGSVERYDEGDLEEGVVQIENSPRWAAVDSKYFSFVFLPRELSIRSLRMERNEWLRPAGYEGEGETVGVLSAVVTLPAGGGATFFAGPKKSELLETVDATLPQLVDYGWFEILVRPLLAALKWVHGYVHNYGWAIIILTFLINMALFPIRYKQMASMQKMSEIQPKLKSVQDKYKRMKRDDPRRQQMNAEVMALYKEHGVNPLGGCLPLVLQMPILFAFYRMLDASIELRGAPFILWIEDLSKADPYMVTPIVMGATMVAQQKMTPATGDPTQRRMMMFLPIVFTFFFLGVSSGLAIYFLFSNVFGMLFQVGLQRLKPELRQKGKSGQSRGKKKQ